MIFNRVTIQWIRNFYNYCTQEYTTFYIEQAMNLTARIFYSFPILCQRERKKKKVSLVRHFQCSVYRVRSIIEIGQKSVPITYFCGWWQITGCRKKKKETKRKEKTSRKKEEKEGKTLKENEKSSKLARKGKNMDYRREGWRGEERDAKLRNDAVQHSILFKLAFSAPTK